MISEKDYGARGWQVVPAFAGESQLPPGLLERMENDPASAGKSSWGTRNVLHSLILSMRPKTVIEIGAHIGSGAVVMGAALKANGFGTLYSLEPDGRCFQLLSQFVGEAGVGEHVRPLKMLSTDKELLDVVRPGEVDMIFLDANHSYSHAFTDITLSDRLLAPNGLLLLDDVGPTMSPQLCSEGRGGVRQALIDFTRGRKDLKMILLEPPFWLNPCGMGIVCKQSPEGKPAAPHPTGLIDRIRSASGDLRHAWRTLRQA